ncbi:MAG: hypothetical protein KQ78_02151 [Candidatus Izimaplasma bacterium HR2]|nr:MAG: hypothetical protein KQ78_02151 [Candidatus Izimaplasma bacterium HR2]
MTIGYQRTGYTEPFITDIDITSGDDLKTTVIYTETNVAVSTINEAISINKTEYKNSPTFGVVATTLTVLLGNGTTVPLVVTNNNFRIGDIFEDTVGFAYEVVGVQGNNITLHRDIVATLTEKNVLLTVAKKLHLFEQKATKDYLIGDKVLESIGIVGISPDPYPILPEFLTGIEIPDTEVLTDAAATRDYYFNTTNFSSIIVDIITTRGATVIVYPLPLEDNLTVVGKASDTTTIADDGDSERVKYSDVAAPNTKIVVTKTQAGDMTNYVFSVHGIK